MNTQSMKTTGQYLSSVLSSPPATSSRIYWIIRDMLDLL